MPGQHSRKSPSKAKLLHECGGALPFIESLPMEMRSTGGDAARLGTATHALIEECLKNDKTPADYEGRLIQITLDKDGNEEGTKFLRPNAKLPKSPEERNRTFEVDGDMILNADLAVEYTHKVLAEHGLNSAALQLETRTNPVPERDDTSGTADITIDAWPTLLEVVDYKNGRLVVEHEDNPQVLSYLAGRAHDTGWCHDEYKITVIQPNGRHHEGKVRTFPITKEDLLAFVVKHRLMAERSDEAEDALAARGGDVTVRLGDEPSSWADVYLRAGQHCGDSFCDARHVCPAYKAWMQAQARIEFADAPPDDMTVKATEEALEVLKWAPALQARIRSASAWLLHEAQAGRMPAGLKFVRKRGKREWAKNDDGSDKPAEILADELVNAGYIGDNAKARLFKPVSLITGPQAEKLVPAKRRAEFSEAYLVKPPGGLKLVPESDPGEAVTFNPGDDFADDEAEGDY